MGLGSLLPFPLTIGPASWVLAEILRRPVRRGQAMAVCCKATFGRQDRGGRSRPCSPAMPRRVARCAPDGSPPRCWAQQHSPGQAGRRWAAPECTSAPPCSPAPHGGAAPPGTAHGIWPNGQLKRGRHPRFLLSLLRRLRVQFRIRLALVGGRLNSTASACASATRLLGKGLPAPSAHDDGHFSRISAHPWPFSRAWRFWR